MSFSLPNELSQEIERLRDLAVGSIDPNISAIALSISDRKVQEIMMKYINEGRDFKGLDVEFCYQTRALKVLYKFDKLKSEFGLIPCCFSVQVNLADRTIVEIIDPYFSFQSTNAPSRPLALDIPSGASKVVASPEELSEKRAREQAFFAERKITPLTERALVNAYQMPQPPSRYPFPQFPGGYPFPQSPSGYPVRRFPWPSFNPQAGACPGGQTQTGSESETNGTTDDSIVDCADEISYYPNYFQ